MKKVVALAKDPAEVVDRFRELISTAVEEFNNGSLGRSVTVVDLAQRMLSQKEIDRFMSRCIERDMELIVTTEKEQDQRDDDHDTDGQTQYATRI